MISVGESMIATEKRAILEDSVRAGTLVLFCGAGLSMGPPTNAPSAATLAENCYDRYLSIGGQLPIALRPDLEGQARDFFNKSHLLDVFIDKVVDWPQIRAFSSNEGHTGVADATVARAVMLSVSTNYDLCVENAAAVLGDRDFQSSIDTDELNLPEGRRHLKLHGCMVRDRHATLWCREQLATQPLQGRLGRARNWLGVNLRNKDVIFAGFWSDWRYLNEAFQACVADVTKANNVFLVDPSELPDLKAKAPDLAAWATNKANSFAHLRMTANEFFLEFREILGEMFLRELLQQSQVGYRQRFGR